MKRIRKKHALAIRWMHWINFPVLAVMIWSGLLIYWANDVYKIRIGGKELIHFFPDSFYKALNVAYHLSEGMAWHFVFMWLFFLNGLLYVLYTIFSGAWRDLVPDKRSFKEAWEVLLHDLYIRQRVPPQKKYNGAQKIAYTGIVVMGVGSVLSGLAMYKPVQFGWLSGLMGGYETSRQIHFILTIGYCLFFIIHMMQVIRAGWQNFSSMVTGFEVLNRKKEHRNEKNNTGKEQFLSDRQLKWRTVFSFVFFFILLGAGAFFFFKVKKQPKASQATGVQTPLRKVLDGNEKIFAKTLSPKHLAKTFPKSAAAKKVRVNGAVGMGDDFDADNWKLKVVKGYRDTLMITIEDIRKLPKTEIVFDFKCIEGWSQVTRWAGVTFGDFVSAYHLEQQAGLDYIGLVTPDSAYYVGIDMASAMHPQTLLCYEMNGEPLPLEQGYPLRLIIPVKYGIKSLKRIGTLFFSKVRPKDYWYERGYDYYSGL